MSETIFTASRQNRHANAQLPGESDHQVDLPAEFLRAKPPVLPQVSELQAVRHFTNLTRRNFSIDTHFYPLGSCTMKYNPRGAHRAASQEGFSNRHPLAPESASQGMLECLYDLQTTLQEVTGTHQVCLAPMAGAQGEFTGALMIKAYHADRNETHRNEIIVPTAAHGTNPATATMAGLVAKEVQINAEGDVDIDSLKAVVSEKTAGVMLTNPSTCAVFEREIEQISQIVHDAGGLLYYDGANLNAILGQVRPGDMQFDILHLNLHKTFATPHGGGGPGAGPVGANELLAPYLPIPLVGKSQNQFRWLDHQDCPKAIGRLSAFAGNVGILLRAYAYALMLGGNGMREVSRMATLNANYLMSRLAEAGFELPYPTRRATHEFTISLRNEAKETGVTAMDFAKRLLDYGFHAPTTYFPLLIPECFLIEPTETESKETLDAFAEAMISIKNEAHQNAPLVKQAPHNQSIGRLDEVQAVRKLDVVDASVIA